jgi:uncharacterized ubiquitin-like protein YukD
VISFTLNSRQQQRLEEWIKTHNKAAHQAAFEECCAPMSPFTYHFTPGSITEHVEVTCDLRSCTVKKIDLSLDDDGNFPDEG